MVTTDSAESAIAFSDNMKGVYQHKRELDQVRREWSQSEKGGKRREKKIIGNLLGKRKE